MKISIHTASVEFEGGSNTYVGMTAESVLSQVADFCRHHAPHEEIELSEPDDDEKVVEEYFEIIYNEEVSFKEVDLEMDAATLSTVLGFNVDDAVKTLSGAEGALDGLVEQVEQMSGMFTDEDGTIEQAKSDAEAASQELYELRKKIAPKTPADVEKTASN